MKKNICFTSFLLITLLSSCTYYLGPNRWASSFPESTLIVPEERTETVWGDEEKLALGKEILLEYKNKKLERWSDKYQDTTIDVRAVMIRLFLEKDVALVNQTILKHEAWGTTGTSSKLNKKGDYDFSEILWAYTLWQFKDRPDLLYPETAKHIVEKLIIDNGNKPTLKAPNTLGLVRETENHILMKEGSRYLKNQWLFEETNDSIYCNKTNGLEDFLVSHLEEMLHTGFFEFNAYPYASYTFEALYIIHAHAHSEEIKSLVQQILDAEHWIYALGSYNDMRYPPFRRRLQHAENTSLYHDRQTFFITTNQHKSANEPLEKSDFNCCQDRLPIALMSDYTLPSHTLKMLEEKPYYYYAKVGHGLKSSPEIYTGNTEYLLSAGGLQFGKRSQIAPRSTVLLLNDGAKDLEETFHIKGKGALKQWNNTGVYQNFAVGNQAVSIPSGYEPIETISEWNIYKISETLFVMTLSQEDLGMIYIARNEADYLITALFNLDIETLHHSFTFPDGYATTINYNPNAKKTWVIKSIDGEKTTKKFKKWGRLDVEFSRY